MNKLQYQQTRHYWLKNLKNILNSSNTLKSIFSQDYLDNINKVLDSVIEAKNKKVSLNTTIEDMENRIKQENEKVPNILDRVQNTMQVETFKKSVLLNFDNSNNPFILVRPRPDQLERLKNLYNSSDPSTKEVYSILYDLLFDAFRDSKLSAPINTPQTFGMVFGNGQGDKKTISEFTRMFSGKNVKDILKSVMENNVLPINYFYASELLQRLSRFSGYLRYIPNPEEAKEAMESSFESAAKSLYYGTTKTTFSQDAITLLVNSTRAFRELGNIIDQTYYKGQSSFFTKEFVTWQLFRELGKYC